MNTKVVLVTPDVAQKWLEGNTHNRTLRQSTVERYARDMTEGRWRKTHQGIAFDSDGVLIDGQHRLWAIFTAGVEIEMLVTYGLDMSAQEVIDGGEVRQARDTLVLRGEGVSQVMVGVAKMLAQQTRKQWNPTRTETVEVFEEHAEAIKFAGSAFPRHVRGIRIVPVLTPVARAFYTEPQTMLLTFGRVLCDGVSTSLDEAPIILLRNWLLEKTPKRADVYGKAERALWAYLNNQPIKTLYKAENELFPMPSETQPKAAKKRKRAS
jgi:hypothetical protein